MEKGDDTIYSFVPVSIIVDRIENDYITLEVNKDLIFTLKKDEMLKVKEGDVLQIDKTSKKFFVDNKKTKKRYNKIKKLMSKVFID